MGYRLSKIYTKTGDGGTTGLGDGSRVDKDHPRVETYGDIDELNSLLGLLLAQELPKSIHSQLTDIQHDLFDLGGELCIPNHRIIQARQVEKLEKILDEINQKLEPLEEFILPGGTQASSLCHLARSVCRRAERKAITLNRSEPIGDIVIPYLNRLSDLLFVIARFLNYSAGVNDVYWDRKRS
jgi:cob(I)alamin adenosyltransferase